MGLYFCYGQSSFVSLKYPDQFWDHKISSSTVPGDILLGSKWLWNDVYHLYPFNDEAKEELSCNSHSLET
jgi:hypothetical protein